VIQSNISINDIDIFVFDFDGVLTDNFVHIDQDGRESVVCSRSDGLGIDALRKIKSIYILSSEKNSVVTSRANKLQIKVKHGVSNKVSALNELLEKESLALDRVFYVGNDLNDLEVMNECKYSACPSDSHHRIKDVATYVLKTKGGKGVVREILEDIFKLDLMKILYNK
jgi:3-deoxy-D-manno-octulosonate 8-phosphate phosphatase (KDO 8-P phosphatase)